VAKQSPTTVSFAMLGQLSIRPHSAYELARLGRRWRDVFWTTPESVAYAEVRDLVRLGLAEAHEQWQGRRRRTVYSISPSGRAALASWLGAPSSPLSIQHEAMLKVLFADAGTRDDLLRAVGEVRDWAAARLRDGEQIASGYLDRTAPYQERAAIVALTFAHTYAMAEAMHRWAEWAAATVATWPEDWPASGSPAGWDEQVFRRAARLGASGA
jgi:DNA-binding PadR family transcriptional regulator